MSFHGNIRRRRRLRMKGKKVKRKKLESKKHEAPPGSKRVFPER